MPIRLIDPKKEFEIEISGTKFFVRQLNGAQKARLMQSFRSVGLDPEMPKKAAGDKIMEALPSMKPILSESLIKMESDDKYLASLSGVDILDRIAEPLDYMMLAMEILNISNLNEGEKKN